MNSCMYGYDVSVCKNIHGLIVDVEPLDQSVHAIRQIDRSGFIKCITQRREDHRNRRKALLSVDDACGI
jgi:hypothetical protein